MKLSKRIKQFRRGRHTKRSGKHTRRKYRGKQYKRTYRKNNRKLKHNKRIQSGGVDFKQIPGTVNYDTQCRLTYKKKGALMEDDNPFIILLENEGVDSYTENNSYITIYRFTVTMTRQTTPQKNFVVNFKFIYIFCSKF